VSGLSSLISRLSDRLIVIESALTRKYSRSALGKRIGVSGIAVTKLIRSGVLKPPIGREYTEIEFNDACDAYAVYKALRQQKRAYESTVPVGEAEMMEAKRQACAEAARQSAGYNGSIRRRMYSSVRMSILTEIAKSGGPCVWMCGNRASASKALCSDCKKKKTANRHQKEADRARGRSAAPAKDHGRIEGRGQKA